MADPGSRNRAARSCITLIGMPACGKSTVGVVLAKKLGKRFIDLDLVIQEETGKLLKDLIEEHGDDGFREIEDRIGAELKAENAVIAPGGSIIYGRKAMRNLKRMGPVVYLKLPFRAICIRIGDLKNRGVTMRPGQTFRQLYQERTKLYMRYADLVVDETGLRTRAVVEKVIRMLEEEASGKEREEQASGKNPAAQAVRKLLGKKSSGGTPGKTSGTEPGKDGKKYGKRGLAARKHAVSGTGSHGELRGQSGEH